MQENVKQTIIIFLLMFEQHESDDIRRTHHRS